MWPFKRGLDPERERDRQMFLEALRLVSSAVEKQTEALQTYFNIFSASGAPESRVMTDEEELTIEAERARMRAPVKWQGES